MDGAALLASGGVKAESSKIRDSRGSVFRVCECGSVHKFRWLIAALGEVTILAANQTKRNATFRDKASHRQNYTIGLN